MKWALEADDWGNLFVTTFNGTEAHRRPVNVSDDVSGELSYIQAAAKHTWTDDVVAAAMERAAAQEQSQREAEKVRAVEAAVERERDDKALTDRALALLAAAGIDLDALPKKKP